jgi:bifunctional non-homologous end joining protein LigD
LAERRNVLAGLIASHHSSIRLSEEFDAEGAAFLKLACEMELEGIIAKRVDAPYRSGRGGEWLKIKCVQSKTFSLSAGRRRHLRWAGLARLLLAARRGNPLADVGSVGTGFTAKSATELRRKLMSILIEKPAVAGVLKKGMRWVEPSIAAEVAFRAWTNVGKLRHASFKGVADVGDIFQM